MIKLFGRVATVEIKKKSGQSREFTYPPFRIDFETAMDNGSTTKLKLYNPNDDTIAMVQGVKNIDTKAIEFPEVMITAGYKDENGMAASGHIYEQKVTREGTETILNLSLSAQAGSWATEIISKSYKKMPPKSILTDILLDSSLQVGSIDVGKNDPVSYIAITLKDSIEYLCRKSDSEYYFLDGKIWIEKKDPLAKPSIVFLDYTSGLIGSPEKTATGWKVKSLFRHKIKRGSMIEISSSTFTGKLRVITGKHIFSSHNPDSITEIEGVVV